MRERDWRRQELRQKIGHHRLRALSHHLAKAVLTLGHEQSVVGAEQLQQRRHDLVDCLLAEDALQLAEGARCRLTHGAVLVAEALAHARDDATKEVCNDIASSGNHELGQPEAHATPAGSVRRGEALLQRGQQLRKHALAQLAHELAHRLRGGLLLVLVLGAQPRNELLRERHQDDAQRLGRVPDEGLPQRARRRAYGHVHVVARDVDGRE